MKAYLYQSDGQLFDHVDLAPDFVRARVPFQVSQRVPLVVRPSDDDDGPPEVPLRTFHFGHYFELGDSGRGLAHYYER
jgi:hypothetical protein